MFPDSDSSSPSQSRSSKSVTGNIFGSQHTLPPDVVADIDSAPAEERSIRQVWIEADCAASKKLTACNRRMIGEGTYVIGRRRSYIGSATEDVPDMLISQREPFAVSRLHCEINVAGEQVVVCDLKSRLGTLVDGVRLGGPKGKVNEISLEPGEHQIVLGARRGGIRLRLTICD